MILHLCGVHMKYHWCDFVHLELIIGWNLGPRYGPLVPEMGWCRCCIGGSRQGRDGLSSRLGDWRAGCTPLWAIGHEDPGKETIKMCLTVHWYHALKKSGKQKSSHVIDCFTTNTIGICCFIHFRHFHVLPVSSSKEIEKMTYIVCAGGLFSRCLHSVCQTCGGRNEVHAMGLGMLDSMVEGKLFRKALYLVAATVSLQNAHLRFNQSIGTSDVQLKGGEVSDEVMRAAPGSWQRKTWCSSQRHSCWPGDDIYGTKKLWQKDATSVYKCVNMVTHCHAVVVDDEMLAKCCKHWTLTYVPPRSAKFRLPATSTGQHHHTRLFAFHLACHGGCVAFGT